MRVLIGIVLMSVTVHAQSHVYTNADLNRPMRAHASPPNDEVMAGIRARQFVAPPTIPTPDGPHVYVMSQPTNMSGPWDWPTESERRRLDGTLFSQPPTVYGLPYLLPFYPDAPLWLYERGLRLPPQSIHPKR